MVVNPSMEDYPFRVGEDPIPKAELQARLAEFLGDAGYYPSKECANGHTNFGNNPIGAFCHQCLTAYGAQKAREYLLAADRPVSFAEYNAWYQAWFTEAQENNPAVRIQRGEPKDVVKWDVVMDIVERLLAQQIVSGFLVTHHAEGFYASVERNDYPYDPAVDNWDRGYISASYETAILAATDGLVHALEVLPPETLKKVMVAS